MSLQTVENAIYHTLPDGRVEAAGDGYLTVAPGDMTCYTVFLSGCGKVAMAWTGRWAQRDVEKRFFVHRFAPQPVDHDAEHSLQVCQWLCNLALGDLEGDESSRPLRWSRS